MNSIENSQYGQIQIRRCDIGRYISGDINLKLWFGIQSSDAADRFGVTGHQPEELYYNFDEESLPEIYQELSNIKDNLGSNLILLHEFFKENDSYSDEKVAEYLNVEPNDIQNILKDYADYELGLKIADAVQSTGQCEFTAEL